MNYSSVRLFVMKKLWTSLWVRSKKIWSAKILSATLAILLLLVVPAIMAFEYLSQISINQFVPITEFTPAGVSDLPPKNPLGVNASSTSTFKSEEKFMAFDVMSRYLTLFKISPFLVRHDLYIENLVNAHVTYKELWNGEIKTITLPSVLACEDKLFEFGKGEYLAYRDLQITEPNSLDRQAVQEIYNKCISHGFLGVQNSLGHPVMWISTEPEPNSGIRMNIRPQHSVYILIYFAAITLWVGFVTLVVGALKSVYKLILSLLS